MILDNLIISLIASLSLLLSLMISNKFTNKKILIDRKIFLHMLFAFIVTFLAITLLEQI
jgi:hypothetical protein